MNTHTPHTQLTLAELEAKHGKSGSLDLRIVCEKYRSPSCDGGCGACNFPGCRACTRSYGARGFLCFDHWDALPWGSKAGVLVTSWSPLPGYFRRVSALERLVAVESVLGSHGMTRVRDWGFWKLGKSTP